MSKCTHADPNETLLWLQVQSGVPGRTLPAGL